MIAGEFQQALLLSLLFNHPQIFAGQLLQWALLLGRLSSGTFCSIEFYRKGYNYLESNFVISDILLWKPDGLSARRDAYLYS